MNYQLSIAILNNSLAHLWNGDGPEPSGSVKPEFLCHCIEYADSQILTGARTTYNHCCTETARELKKIIMKRIDGFATVGSFLRHTKGDLEFTEIQAYRRKMLEDILAEYKKKALLVRQIEVLEQVKELRATNPYRSDYVCDNIRHGVVGYDIPSFGLGLNFTPESKAICADIKEYIKGRFSLDCFLGMEDQHEEVEPERIKMIDTLIQRYQAQLEAA